VTPPAIAPVDLYGRELVTDAAAILARSDDGRSWSLPLQRYLGPLTDADRDVLARAAAPVVDIGCGPGRHVLALARRGMLALGVDVSPVAVRMARERGASVLQGSVFDQVPGAGSWGTALLLDGNIGIGGAPSRLLARIGVLLRKDGELLLELGSPREPTGAMLVRIETDHGVSSWFPWARVSVGDLDRLARSSGFRVRERASLNGRWFARLGRA
jgi:SAM-dependent methyltransferase